MPRARKPGRPAHRRRGLARATLSRVVDLGEQLGLDRLELLSSEAARGLYEALGFVRSGDDHLPMEYSYRTT